MDAPTPAAELRFGAFVLDQARAELRRDGLPVPLRPKTFELLRCLALAPGTLRTKQELYDAVWPNVVVGDDSLSQAVHELRVALGDEDHRLVRTVARRGYRLEADVETLPHAVGDAGGALPESAAPAGRADRVEPGRRRSARRLGIVAAAVAAFVATVAAALLSVRDVGPPPDRPRADARPAVASAPRQSIVVLPLEVEDGAEIGQPFADTLSADLTHELGQVAGSVVISRETAFAYRGGQVDPREVARQLGVRHVVRGTVGRAGDVLRLELALIDGETGRRQWAERFELDRSRLQASLQQVTGAVARTLGIEVVRAEGRRAAKLDPAQIEADDLAMQGWALWYRGLSRENTLAGWRAFEAAVARDPDALRAWAGISLLAATAVNSGWAEDPAAARARQHEAIRQLERLDPNAMVTQMARVGVFYRTEDFVGLLQLADALVARFPNEPYGHHQRSIALMVLGRFDECVPPAGRAARLGPRDSILPNILSVLAMCHFFAHRYAEAVAQARLAVQANTSLAGPLAILAASLARDHRPDEAGAVVAEVLARGPWDDRVLLQVLRGSEPRLVEGRERLLGTLDGLGLRERIARSR